MKFFFFFSNTVLEFRLLDYFDLHTLSSTTLSTLCLQSGKVTDTDVLALYLENMFVCNSDILSICFRWKMGLVCFGKSQS